MLIWSYKFIFSENVCERTTAKYSWTEMFIFPFVIRQNFIYAKLYKKVMIEASNAIITSNTPLIILKYTAQKFIPQPGFDTNKISKISFC